jgi:hypothetical protein
VKNLRGNQLNEKLSQILVINYLKPICCLVGRIISPRTVLCGDIRNRTHYLRKPSISPHAHGVGYPLGMERSMVIKLFFLT